MRAAVYKLGDKGLLPKSKFGNFGVAALLRSAEFPRKMNDPRFAEARLQSEKSFGQQAHNTLKFAFFDATNMPDKFAMHRHNLTFTFRDNDHFAQEWTLYQNGKEAQKVVMEFERVK